MMKKIFLLATFISIVYNIGFSQSCDCDIYPIKKECKEKCGMKLLQTGTKDQIKDTFHVTEETAKKIVSVSKRKNKTSIADFQEDLPYKYYKDLDSVFNVFLGTNIIQNSINAPNAQIVTQNQSGGNNTVINPQVGVPLPTVKYVSTEVQNKIVKEVTTGRGPRNEKVSLPSEEFKYDSLYKTTFTIAYSSKVSLNQIIFRVKRKDIILMKVTHGGSMMSREGSDSLGKIFQIAKPEDGYYTFDIYTVNKFGDVMTTFDYLLE